MIRAGLAASAEGASLMWVIDVLWVSNILEVVAYLLLTLSHILRWLERPGE
jgi:hypothetical protein